MIAHKKILFIGLLKHLVTAFYYLPECLSRRFREFGGWVSIPIICHQMAASDFGHRNMGCCTLSGHLGCCSGPTEAPPTIQKGPGSVPRVGCCCHLHCLAVLDGKLPCSPTCSCCGHGSLLPLTLHHPHLPARPSGLLSVGTGAPAGSKPPGNTTPPVCRHALRIRVPIKTPLPGFSTWSRLWSHKAILL